MSKASIRSSQSVVSNISVSSDKTSKKLQKEEKEKKKQELKKEIKEQEAKRKEEKKQKRLQKKLAKKEKSGKSKKEKKPKNAKTNGKGQITAVLGDDASATEESESDFNNRTKISDGTNKLEGNGEATLEDDSYLNTLIESDQLEPSVRAVFEAAKENEILRNLQVFVRKKERDIDDICSWHYQEFIRAVDELLEVKAETSDLREHIKELNDDFQKSGKGYLTQYKKLLELRHMRANVAFAIDLVQECQFLLSLMAQIEDQVHRREFYSALKNLAKLEKIYIPRVKHYNFIQYFESTIPSLKNKIKKETTEDFNTWLLNLRTHVGEIGKFAVEQTSAQIRVDEKLHISTRTISDYLVKSLSEDAHDIPTSPQNNKKDTKNQKHTNDVDEEVIEESLFHNKRFKIDFTPLYQCFEVYKELGLESEFQQYYRDNRKLQANMALKPKHGLSFATTDGYKKYFYDIAGFFIVEETVSESTVNLVPTSATDKLWQMAVAKIKGVLQEQMSYTLEPQVLLQVKHFLFVFSKTMQGYNYDVTRLIGFFDNVRTTFADLAINSAHKKFISLLDQHKWVQLTIRDEKEYEKLILQNKLQITDSKYLPQSFVFSSLVPQYCLIIKNFIIDFYRFAKNLPDLDEYTKKSTETVIRLFNQTWINFVSPSSSMQQYAQTWINLQHLSRVTFDWEDCLSELSYQGGKIKLNTSSFQEYQSQTEAMMLELVEAETKQFIAKMRSQNVNWTHSEGTEPRKMIVDIVAWLEQNITLWAPLPTDIQINLQLRCFHKLSRGFVAWLESDEVYRFNTHGIRNLDIDLRHLESFSERSKIKTPKDTFSEIRQLLDLLLSENMEEFTDPQIRKQRYYRLFDLHKLLSILEKFKEESRFMLKRKGAKDQQIAALVSWLKKEIAPTK